MNKPKVGDAVTWRSSEGLISGHIIREQTTPTAIKGHKVAASKDNPQFIVKSERTGAIAAHKPLALKKPR